DSIWVVQNGLNAAPCAFHKIIHLDATARWQVTSSCENPVNMKHLPWFVLPPVEEHFYKTGNPNYKVLPPFREDCKLSEASANPMQLIYPKNAAKIYVPLDMNGKRSHVVF